tara:strand:+ start:16095 stop:16319 length:225 start_codon:yes stop_codon:yes gene_type:complete
MIEEFTISKLHPGGKFKFNSTGHDFWSEEFVLLEKKKVDGDAWSIVFDLVNQNDYGIFEICAVVKENIDLELIV